MFSQVCVYRGEGVPPCLGPVWGEEGCSLVLSLRREAKSSDPRPPPPPTGPGFDLLCRGGIIRL